ncbi:MAG: DinB family protein [Acidimicrobiales bacterium]
MSTVAFMKQALRFIDRGFAEADEGLTDEQLHFVPEGQTHSIAWCMWHAARIEDLFVQRIYKGGQEEWRTGGWAERCGLPEKGFGTGQSTEDAQAVHITDRAAFKAYQAKVHELAMEYFDSITDADLDRETKLGDQVETLGHSINMHLTVHLNGHRGEVNMLRGMMGFEPVLVNQGG